MNVVWNRIIVIPAVPLVPIPLAVLSVSVFLVLLEMELHVKVSNDTLDIIDVSLQVLHYFIVTYWFYSIDFCTMVFCSEPTALSTKHNCLKI